MIRIMVAENTREAEECSLASSSGKIFSGAGC
jgi:hypothetical protein